MGSQHFLQMKKLLKDIWSAIVRAITIEIKQGDVMLVFYYPNSNYIECQDWCSQKISSLSGKYSSEFWNYIKPYFRKGTTQGIPTRIYIWAGMEKKHLAYCEPVENYVANEKLLQTGQGFHFGSGVRYGEKVKIKCATCGK